MEIVLASKNPRKRRELEEILRETVPKLSVVEAEWPDVAETAMTFRENALLKARTVHTVTGFFALADDSGLEVDALDGAPGVWSARFALPAVQEAAGRSDSSAASASSMLDPSASADLQTQANNAELLRRLDGVTDRRARFRCVIALCGETEAGVHVETTVEGRVEGVIVQSPVGNEGFGYDPLFRPVGWDCTFAEAGPVEKATVSHRARALSEAAVLLSKIFP